MALEVLVVDDEADIRELVSGVLEDEGFSVRTAGAVVWACTADAASRMARPPRRRVERIFRFLQWMRVVAPAHCRRLRHCRKHRPPRPFVRLRPPSVELRSDYSAWLPASAA